MPCASLPSAETIQIGLPAVGVYTIRFFSPQSIPRVVAAAASVVADPPRIGIFFTFPSTQNASHSPSGEKQTSAASSVPVTGRSVRSSSRRTEIILFVPLLSIVMSATFRPSSEISSVAVLRVRAWPGVIGRTNLTTPLAGFVRPPR